VTNTQVTLVQIDNYGPWTVTPEPRREVDLQTLQSRLYADLSQLFGNREGYVFFTRFDNMIAVTNGLDHEAHALIQESVRNRYPVTVSLGVGVDPSPAVALGDATTAVQDGGNEFDTFINIEQGYAALMRYMRQEHDSLSFFVGGDNIISVCPDLGEPEYRDAIDAVYEEVGVELKVGVGRSRTAQGAGMAAKHALEVCREDGTTVEFDD
jgi:GTP cyclohydrolase IIa